MDFLIERNEKIVIERQTNERNHFEALLQQRSFQHPFFEHAHGIVGIFRLVEGDVRTGEQFVPGGAVGSETYGKRERNRYPILLEYDSGKEFGDSSDAVVR